MTVFTTEELNLICIYDPGNRKGTIKELKNMMRYLIPDETELHDLADGVIHKLKEMSDEEYDELSDSLTPDCSFDCEDSAYGGFPLDLFGEIDPNAEIE